MKIKTKQCQEAAVTGTQMLEEFRNQTKAGNSTGTVTVTMKTLGGIENDTETEDNDREEDDYNIRTIEEILTSSIQENIQSISSELRVMESLIHEEKQLGAVQCHWNMSQESSRRNCFLPSILDEHFGWIAANSRDGYGRTLEAKFACERRGPECIGVSLYLDGAFFQLLTKCREFDSGETDTAIEHAWFKVMNRTGMNTEEGNMTAESWHRMELINKTYSIWLKDCSGNQSSDATGSNLLQESSRIHRNDFDSDTTDTTSMQPRVNFTTNRTFRGEQSNMTAAFWHNFEARNVTTNDSVANFLQHSSRNSSHVVPSNTEAEASVTVYEDANYTGYSALFTGYVDIKQPWNTRISSLQFPWTGWSIVAFDREGRQVAYNGDTTYVGDEMNDRISSLTVLPFRIDELCYTVYEDSYYRGLHQRFCGDQDLSSSTWNKKISSLRVDTEGCGVILYDWSYEGNFKMFSGDVPFVGREWKNKATSIQIRPWILDDHEGQIPPRQVSVTVYEHRNYAGSSIVFTGTVEIEQPWNAKISSIRFPWGGWSVVAFGLDGRQVAYNGDNLCRG